MTAVAPTVTVLITAHNYGQFIEQAIDSVLSQDFPQESVEVVVVDDGSADDTSDRIKKYGPRVRYLYQPNAGQAAALNLGFEKAKGDVVALLDADDFFLPGKLTCVAEAFSQNPAVGLVYHPIVEWDMRTGERRDSGLSLISGDLRSNPTQFLFYNAYPTSAVSFRKCILSPLLPIPKQIRMMADGYLAELVPFLCPVLGLSDALVTYRIHGSNYYYAHQADMPAETRKSRLDQRQILLDAMCKWLADNDYTKKQPSVRFFLRRWATYQLDEPHSTASGRLSYFRAVLRENYLRAPSQSWKFTALNYVTSPLALVFGHKNPHLLQKCRANTLRFFEQLFHTFGELS